MFFNRSFIIYLFFYISVFFCRCKTAIKLLNVCIFTQFVDFHRNYVIARRFCKITINLCKACVLYTCFVFVLGFSFVVLISDMVSLYFHIILLICRPTQTVVVKENICKSTLELKFVICFYIFFSWCVK